jgi:hypothetical protein
MESASSWSPHTSPPAKGQHPNVYSETSISDVPNLLYFKTTPSKHTHRLYLVRQIGENIDAEAVEEFRDSESDDIYTMTHYEDGEE